MKTVGYILMSIGVVWVTLLAAVFFWSDKDKDWVALGIGIFIFMLPGIFAFLIGLILKLQAKKPARVHRPLQKSVTTVTQEVKNKPVAKKVIQPIEKVIPKKERIEIPKEVEEVIDYRYESNRGYWNVKCTRYAVISILLLIIAGIAGVNERWIITGVFLVTSGVSMILVYRSFLDPN